jgi:hypothetical protein
MRRKIPAVTAAALAVAALAGALVTSADDDHGRRKTVFRARLAAENEVPACSSTGRGSATFKIDDDAQTIEFEVSYTTEANPTVAHVHLGQRFAAGGVSFFLCGGAPPQSNKPACPASPATITGTIVPTDVIGPTGQGIAAGEFAEIVAAIRDGNTYANVHSSICPGGEIRGQLH